MNKNPTETIKIIIKIMEVISMIILLITIRESTQIITMEIMQVGIITLQIGITIINKALLDKRNLNSDKNKLKSLIRHIIMVKIMYSGKRSNLIGNK